MRVKLYQNVYIKLGSGFAEYQLLPHNDPNLQAKSTPAATPASGGGCSRPDLTRSRHWRCIATRSIEHQPVHIAGCICF